MIASTLGGDSKPSDTLLPGKAGDAVAVRRTLVSTICRIADPTQVVLDRGSSATHQRSCGPDPRIRV
jgi:hypothetical protein